MGCIANNPRNFMMPTAPTAIPPFQDRTNNPSNIQKAHLWSYTQEAPSMAQAYSKQPALPRNHIPYNPYSQASRNPVQLAPYRGVYPLQGQIVRGTYPNNEDCVDENAIYDSTKASNMCSIKVLEPESSRDMLRPRNFKRT